MLGGCLATMMGPGVPEIGEDGRDYGLERRRGVVFASIGLVLCLLSLFRLLPDGY